MNKEKRWYKVTYDGGWFKADSIEDIIETISGPGNFYEGRIKRIIEVTERDIDILNSLIKNATKSTGEV